MLRLLFPLVLLSLTLLVGPVWAVDGYEDARWGSSPEAVQAALGEVELRPAPLRLRFERGRRGAQFLFYEGELMSQPATFTFRFHKDHAGEQVLDAVEVRLRAASFEIARALVEVLSIRHGDGARSSRTQKADGAAFRVDRWAWTTEGIWLQWSDEPGVKGAVMRYERGGD